MVTSQKSVVPVAALKAKPNQLAARPTPPVAAAHPTPPSGDPDSACFVHRLEEALQLVESMQLTNDQKTKISQLTKAQTARCTEEKKQHKTTHEQILALLTPDQHQKLQAASDGPEHCHKDSHTAPAKHALNA
jgi:Spy/CpxP family protein refolding chaperone